jgi:hypothetical protein
MMRKQIVAVLGIVVVTAVSVYMRQRGMAAASALGDAIHPWWAALRPGWPRPHAAPFGWGLNLTYSACLVGADSLWVAVQRMLCLQAMVAPVTVLAAWSISRRLSLTGLVLGLVIALDGGLIDTSLSGAEGYLGALFIGLMVLGIGARDRFFGPLLTGTAFALAVMNHPLAIVAAPLFLCLRLGEPRAWIAPAWAALLLMPRINRFFSEPLAGGAGLGPPDEAIFAFLNQGGVGALIVLLGPIVGLFARRTRALSLTSVCCFVLLFLLGHEIDYLRDHHLRLLSVPALMGWAAMHPVVGLLLMVGLRVPPHPVFPAGHTDRPGTLGMAHLITDRLVEQPGPLVVDGVWLGGTPAASPSAIMLDLHLRSWTPAQLHPGERVVVLVSGERADMGRWPAGLDVLEQGERHALLAGSTAQVHGWAMALCARRSAASEPEPKLGGVTDALSVLHPDLPNEQIRGGWACP